MQSANGTSSRLRAVFAFCLLNFALLGCTKTQPSSPAASAGSANPVDQLRQDLSQTTRLAGVQRATWGVVVHSLDRNERLYELNPRTLLVPASVAKLVKIGRASCRER